MEQQAFDKTAISIETTQNWIAELCRVYLSMSAVCGLGEEDRKTLRMRMDEVIKQLAYVGGKIMDDFQLELGAEAIFVAELRDKIYEAEMERAEALRERAKIDHPSSPAVRSAVHALTDGHCAYCDDKLGDDWQVEHVVPASLGGPDSIANYVPSCKPCNHKKSTKHVIEFIKLRRGKFAVVEGDKAAEA